MNTPWGRADQIDNMGGGIISVSTPSHGGLRVPMDLYRTMPAPLQTNVYGGGNWFEEDCEWALVALAFPQYFDKRAMIAAVATINAYETTGSQYHAAYLWLHGSPEGKRRLVKYGPEIQESKTPAVAERLEQSVLL